MNVRKENLQARADKYLAQAMDRFNAGFVSRAAQQLCLDALNRAYDCVNELAHDDLVAAAPVELEARNEYFANVQLPFGLHQVRDKHAANFGSYWAQVQQLIELREAVKNTAPAPAVKVETRAQEIERRVTESLTALMERRKAQFIEGCQLHDIFGGLPVSLNAHWVQGHKGTTFIRRFYYMNGKLTPLGVIIAVLEAKEIEKGE